MKTKNPRLLSRNEVKEVFTMIFENVSHYRNAMSHQWRDQTLDFRMSPKGRDMGTHIDNLNNILDAIERLLHCEKAES